MKRPYTVTCVLGHTNTHAYEATTTSKINKKKDNNSIASIQFKNCANLTLLILIMVRNLRMTQVSNIHFVTGNNDYAPPPLKST